MHSRRRCNCRPSRQYTNYNNMSYRVETLDFSVSPKDLMPEQRRSQKEPRQTYVAYYKKKYTITIKDLDQPLFMVRQRGEKIYLVPELCVTTVSAMERLSLFTHPSSTNGAPSRFEIIVLISPPPRALQNIDSASKAHLPRTCAKTPSYLYEAITGLVAELQAPGSESLKTLQARTPQQPQEPTGMPEARAFHSQSNLRSFPTPLLPFE